MKKLILIILVGLLFSSSQAQINNSTSLSVKNIDSIVRAVKNKNKLITYKALDSTLSKFYYVDRKSKDLLAVDMINHYYARRKEKISDYYRFIYYFHKEEVIKLYVIYCTNRKDCKKGIFYFSGGKVIQKEGVLADDVYLKKPLEFSLDFKSFVNRKNNGG